jgi:hypothetical protein
MRMLSDLANKADAPSPAMTLCLQNVCVNTVLAGLEITSRSSGKLRGRLGRIIWPYRLILRPAELPHRPNGFCLFKALAHRSVR